MNIEPLLQSADKKKKSASPAKPSTKRKVASDSDSSNSDIDTQLIELINEKKKEVNPLPNPWPSDQRSANPFPPDIVYLNNFHCPILI